MGKMTPSYWKGYGTTIMPNKSRFKNTDELRQCIAIRHSIDEDTRVDTSLDEVVDYIHDLEARIAALEGGAQNKPFILPAKEKGDHLGWPDRTS